MAQFMASPYMGYNMNAQQRLNNMEQMYQQPGYAQQQPQQMGMQGYGMQPNQFQQNQVSYLKGRAVTSVDEAKAAMIDLDGSLHVFTDLGNKKIYTKQINLDGTATLNIFSLEEVPAQKPQENKVVFVEKGELDCVVNSLREELDNLRKQLEIKEGAVKNVQSDANDGSRRK